MGHEIYVAARMLTNLIPSPDMEGSGWVTGNNVSYSTERAYAGTRSLKMVGTSGSAETTCNTTANVQLNNAHFYYAAVFGWQDTKTNGARVGFYWPIAEPSFNDNIPVGEAGQWVRYSATNNRNGFANGGYPFRIDWNNGGAAGTIYYDGAMLIDLTAEFGSGNEPTKEWCDNHIYFNMGGNACILDEDSDSMVKRVKKTYIGVDDVARKIKRVYIGVGNTARLCYTDGSEPVYADKSTLSLARRLYEDGASSVGNYALFFGGQISAGYTNVVDAFNCSRTRTLPTVLSVARSQGASTTVGNYAIYAGGVAGSNNIYGNVDYYNSSLTRGNATSLGYARYAIRSASVNNVAVLAGGTRNVTNGVYNDMDCYNSSLTRIYSGTPFSNNFYRATGTTVGNYAIFAGGYSSYCRNEAYAVTSSLSVSMITSLSVARSWPTSATAGNYALIIGGMNDSDDHLSVVEAYTDSLTRVPVEDMVLGRGVPIATALGDFAIIMGSYYAGGTSNTLNQVDIYNSSLIHTVERKQKPAILRFYAYKAATTIGDYAMFAGGTSAQHADFTDDIYFYTI